MAERVIEAAELLDDAPRDSQRGLSLSPWSVVGLGFLLALLSAPPFVGVMVLGARGAANTTRR